MNEVMAYATAAAALVSLGALWVSVAAFRRAGRIDKRAHEHNDVKWFGYWNTNRDGTASFYLQNRGSTTAKHVRVDVMSGAGERRTHAGLGTFKGGRTKLVTTEQAESHAAAELLIALFQQQGAECTVNWVSPLGSAKEDTFLAKY